jgi:hypothetical protein
MTTPNNTRQPLKTISENGTYNLRLTTIKPEKFKTNEQGIHSVTLWFLDSNGNNLNKRYTSEYPKSLATLVGKFTNKYMSAPKEGMTIDEFYAFLKQAENCTAAVQVEVTPKEPWKGIPQFKYKFAKIASILGNPEAGDQPQSQAEEITEAPPF